MDPAREVYARARRLLEEEPGALLAELDRVIGAASREVTVRLEEAVRLGELALIARLDPWWAGPPQPNLRSAVARVERALHDPLALGLGLRLAAGYARLGRVDDEAHRLARLAARLEGTGLRHPEDGYAREAARHLEQAAFLPSAPYAYELVRELEPAPAAELVAAQLARGNPSFAALLAEMALARALAPWYVGPSLPNVERALVAYRERRPEALDDLAVLLARAYVRGGFVDLRARDHVRAVLEGAEAQLLGPDEAIGLQDYVDRDCFDYPYEHVYRVAKALAPDELRARVRGHTKNGALAAAQRLCEMSLVRRYDDWYVGDPTPNVRSAVARFLEDETPDPDASWCARYLAGLYAATLEGSSHARQLVHATVASDPGAPAFSEAFQAAGIPPDVTVDELHALYKGVVEVEARVEAFRALAAEQTRAPLSDYEREAYAEVLRFLEAGERTLVSDVSSTLGGLVEVVVPDAMVRSVTAVVEDVLRLAVSGASAALRRDRILGELARRDPALRTLERIREADLRLLDEVAWALTRENRIAAALEGLGCGLGGATLVLVDLPMLILVNLNAVAAIATVYGFDVDAPREREFAVALLASGPEALRQAVAASSEQQGEERNAFAEVAHLTTNRAALAVHTAAAQIASRLARSKLAQLLPVLGGAVGAGLNFHYTHATTRAAVMAYRYRWLMRRFAQGAGSGSE